MHIRSFFHGYAHEAERKSDKIVRRTRFFLCLYLVFRLRKVRGQTQRTV